MKTAPNLLNLRVVVPDFPSHNEICKINKLRNTDMNQLVKNVNKY